MPEIIEQWKFYFSILAPQRGDRILDIGCNTGDTERLLLQEYPDIHDVTGVERDPRRHRRAGQRCRAEDGAERIRLLLADGCTLPVRDESVDKVFCVETLEYIANPRLALEEIRRVLATGGTAAIIHSDFDTQVFAAQDTQRTRRIVQAFSDTGPNGHMGRQLHGLCNAAGFSAVEIGVYALISTEWNPQAYPYRMAHLMANGMQQGLSPDARQDVQEWLGDLEETHQRGEFFYSINRYICRCTK